MAKKRALGTAVRQPQQHNTQGRARRQQGLDEQRSSVGPAPGTGGVTLASLHAAKGLEWDAVFLPGLTDGAVPIVYAQSAEAIEEERRLLYVGITRARERLFLSWSLARTPGGRKTRKRSRFLDELRGGGQPRRRSAAAPARLTGTVPQ
jgi:DNA helicase-2/ATP-dependent DNA helicase PcrA